LDKGVFIAVFVHNRVAVGAVSVDARESLLNFRGQWEGVQDTTGAVSDARALFWHAIRTLKKDEEVYTTRDRLALGWVNCYKLRLQDLHSQVTAIVSNPELLLPVLSITTSTTIKELVGVLLDASNVFRATLDFVQATAQDLGKANELFKENIVTFSRLEHRQFAVFFNELLECHLWSPSFSDCGQVVIWLDPFQHKLKELRLEPRLFAPKILPAQYWERLIGASPWVGAIYWTAKAFQLMQ